MIYITGDTHCPVDIHKLSTKSFTIQSQLTKKDYLIICGDCGLVWKEGSKEDLTWQKWFQEKNFTTLFVDGNHENHDLLNEMPVEIWNGGKVHRIKDSVLHLMRGQVFDLDGMRFFTMGGANSTDKMYRREGISWWKAEMPDESEYMEAFANLDKAEWKLDFVVSHTAPDKIITKINPWFEHDRLTNFLQTVQYNLEYKKWFFGHFHEDTIIDEKHVAMYQKIYDLNKELII